MRRKAELDVPPSVYRIASERIIRRLIEQNRKLRHRPYRQGRFLTFLLEVAAGFQRAYGRNRWK